MPFGIDTIKNFSKRLSFPGIRKLRGYTPTNFQLKCALRRGTVRTVMKKTSIPFKNVGNYKPDRSNPIKVWWCWCRFYRNFDWIFDSSLKKVKQIDCAEGCDYLS